MSRSFFERQEQEVVFIEKVDMDGWNANRGKTETKTAIVADSTSRLDPTKATIKEDSLRIFLKSQVSSWNVIPGDLVRVYGIDYVITNVDWRGVLPNRKYKYRVEAKRS